MNNVFLVWSIYIEQNEDIIKCHRMLDDDSKLLLVHKSIVIDQVVEPITLIADNYSGRFNGSRQLGFYLL